MRLDRDTARAMVDAGFMPLALYIQMFGVDRQKVMTIDLVVQSFDVDCRDMSCSTSRARIKNSRRSPSPMRRIEVHGMTMRKLIGWPAPGAAGCVRRAGAEQQPAERVL